MASPEQRDVPQQPWAHTWPRAALVAVGVCALLFVLLAWVPDRLVTFLQRHEASPTLRDVAVTAEWVIALVIVLGGLRVLQRRGGI